MGQFQASLRMPGDSRALAAVVLLHEGRLQVASGDHVIGDWAIDTIEISQIPEGIRVAADGEVLLLDISDRATFEQEAAALHTVPGRRLRTAKTPRTRAVKPARTGAATAVEARTPRRARTQSKLDLYLERARDRFGSKIPKWVFSRIGLGAALALVLLTVIFADLVSNLLLIAGVMVLLVGGVTMLDSVIARRVLQHKVTPIQVVIGGGTLFVVGLLIGFAA
ncbi:MAG TPA: hypothetical protein VK990_09370 [Acidimicrobiia bacterium]|nr:hypothetical protein [Acidimicrobiia bacterium]